MPFDLSPEEIARNEARLGYALPEAYRRVMAKRNGGTLTLGNGDEYWELHPLRDESSRERLRRTSNDVEHETREARAWSGFPEEAVSVASDGSGNHLVLLPDATGTRLGDAVYVWDHETEDLSLVAESLESLSEQ